MFQDRRMDDADEPLLLNLGVTLAVPLAVYIISSLRFPTANGSNNDRPPTGNNRCSLPATFGCGRGLKDALQLDQNMLSKIIHGAATPTTTSADKFPCCSKISEIAEGFLPSDPLCSPAIACSEDDDEEEEGILLQESNQEPAEALIPVANEPSAPEATADGPLNAEPDNKEVEEEQQFACLSNMFQSLYEMDTLLQIQMLEFHGRKEREGGVRDMENRLRASELEIERLQAKMDSLQNENEMLNLQASQFLRNIEELESEKARAKHLRRKLKSARTQARAKSGALEQRICMLQEKLQKTAQDEAEVRDNLERLRGVEAEVAELRVRNSTLSQENLDLARRLDSAQKAAAMPCSHETSDQVNRSSEASDKLENKVGQLESDHFGDEEFMYLRWLSARLRYQTKKHAQLPWKKSRDRSSSTSPESGNKTTEPAFDSASECTDEKSSKFRHLDLDMEYCCSPGGSNAEKPSVKRGTGSQKPKLFCKFKKLLTRKSCENNKVSPMMAAAAADEDVPAAWRCSSDGMASSGFTVENSVRGAQYHEDDNWQNNSAWIQASYRSPRNVPKASSRRSSTEDVNNKVAHCMSDLGASMEFMRTANGAGKLIDRESQPKILGR